MRAGFEDVIEWGALERRWRALEGQARGGFFRSWDFLGCEAAARFDAPVLLSVRDDGQDVALALCNRHGGRLYLQETGRPALDAVCVEHNGFLIRAGGAAALQAGMTALAGRGPVVLSGIDDATLASARAAGLVVTQKAQVAPVVDLAALRGPYLESLSANTRAQIRRAMRLCAAPPVLAAAADLAQALDWFAAMVTLHQARWAVRGQKGAFADAAMVDFHRALLARALPAGSATLLRVSAGDTVLGYLYVLLGGGTAHVYQSGFIAAADARHKPGLICHALAVEHFRALGMTRYDLMAKADRYKTSLAPGGGPSLHWVTLYPAGAWRGRLALAARALKPRLHAALAWRKPAA